MTGTIIAIIVLLVWLTFKKETRTIRKLQKLLARDTSVCDVINSYPHWCISRNKSDTLMLLANTMSDGLIKFYLTYDNRWPEKAELVQLYEDLTSDESGVLQAYLLDIPVAQYLQEIKNNPEKLAESNKKIEEYIGQLEKPSKSKEQ